MPESTAPETTAWPAGRRITISNLQAATDRGERWSMLTSYDTLTASVFEQAGVRALLVGDTSAEVVLGYETTVPVTLDQLIPMVQAVVRGTRTALVVADGHWKTRGRSPSCSSRCQPGSPGGSPRSCGYRRWGSAPGRTATRRSWSGRIWPG